MQFARPEAMAEDILQQFWDGRLPVDVKGIARALGVKVVLASDLAGISGEVTRTSGGGYTIKVNRNDPRVRKRFTIAHELGHIALGHLAGEERRLRDPRENYSLVYYDPKERDANRFAAELLMPSDAVRNAIMRLEGDDMIRQLADLFSVSRTAMGIRLKALGIIPLEVEI